MELPSIIKKIPIPHVLSTSGNYNHIRVGSMLYISTTTPEFHKFTCDSSPRVLVKAPHRPRARIATCRALDNPERAAFLVTDKVICPIFFLEGKGPHKLPPFSGL